MSVQINASLGFNYSLGFSRLTQRPHYVSYRANQVSQIQDSSFAIYLLHK